MLDRIVRVGYWFCISMVLCSPSASGLDLSVFGCEITIDDNVHVVTFFNADKMSVSFYMDDGSRISISEDGVVPEQSGERKYGRLIINRGEYEGFRYHEVELITKSRNQRIDMVHILDQQGHKLTLSGPITSNWRKKLTRCNES